MKILIAAEIFPPAVGGPATHLAVILPELIRRGHSVRVVTFGKSRIVDTYPDVKVKVVEIKKFLPFRYIEYFLFLFFYSFTSDVLYAMGSVISGYMSFLVSKITKKPYLVRIPGDFIWEYCNRGEHQMDIEFIYNSKQSVIVEFLKKIQRIVINHARLVFVTSFAQQKNTQYWGIDQNISVLYSGIPPVATEKTNKEKYIISPGRLISIKGFTSMIPMIATWLLKHPDYRLVIIGDGPEEKNIKKVVQKYGIVDQVIYTGKLDQSKMHDWYAKSQVCLFYSKYDALPNAVFEAMSFGLGIIATKVGGFPEILADYPRGALVAEGDETGLSDALDKVLDMVQMQKPITNYLEKYSQEKMFTQFESLLLEAGRR